MADIMPPAEPSAQPPTSLLATRDTLREVLAEHFVMWHALGHDGPPGEWRCACGLRFGFSNSAIDHQADMVAGVVRDPATLGTDEALVERMWGHVVDVAEESTVYYDDSKLWLTALTAALSEDPS